MEDDCFYESMEDEDEEKKLSPRLKRFVDEYIAEKHWEEEDIQELLNDSIIYYSNGKERHVWIDFADDTISEEIEMVYGYEMANLDETFMYYLDQYDDTENLVNIQKISMIELPLLKVEDAICRRNDDESKR